MRMSCSYINCLAFMVESFNATNSVNDIGIVVNSKVSTTVVKCHFVEYNSNLYFRKLLEISINKIIISNV